MPRFDKTGPEGKGSKTGRAAGDCSDSKLKDNNGEWFSGFSRRRSGRRGFWRVGRHEAEK